MNYTRISDDGSTEGGQRLGWQGGYDWEVYRDAKPMRAELFDEDMLIAVVTAKGIWRLTWKMGRAQKRLGITKATVLG